MNTKPIIGWIAVALCLCAWRPTAANPRIAVVNIEALVRAHPRTVADKTHLEETLRGYEAEGDRLREQIDALRATFERVRAEAEDSALSPQARQRAATAADEARQSWVEARDDWHEQMQRMQQRLTEQELRLLNRTFSELRREIGDYAEAEGIGVVLDASERRMGGGSGVIFADPALDITDAILTRIGGRHPEQTEQPEATEATP